MRSRGLAVLLFAAAAAGVARADPPAAPTPPASPRTVVAPHPGVPIEPGRNVLWCATIQLAWDAMADWTGARTLPLGPPADAATVEALNRRSFPAEAIDPAAVVVAAGLWDEDRRGRVARELVQRFGAGVEPPPPATGLPTSFAHLEKSLPFAHAFPVFEEPMSFAGGSRRVRTFGLHAAMVPPAALARQVVLHRDRAAESSYDHDEPPPPFVVELLPRDASDRILLASVPPAPTLLQTWKSAEALVASVPGRPYEVGPELAVPVIDLDVDHAFSELSVGVPGRAGGAPLGFRQRTRFRLDETGARLESRAIGVLGMAPPLRFDRPFLLALLRRGATHPYFLLWVGNDDLLEGPVTKDVPPETLARLVGRWTLDRDATLNAWMKNWPDRTTRKESAAHLAAMTFDLRVEGDGRAQVTMLLDSPPPPPGGWTAMKARVVRVGERIALEVESEPAFFAAIEGEVLVVPGEDGRPRFVLRRAPD